MKHVTTDGSFTTDYYLMFILNVGTVISTRISRRTLLYYCFITVLSCESWRWVIKHTGVPLPFLEHSSRPRGRRLSIRFTCSETRQNSHLYKALPNHRQLTLLSTFFCLLPEMRHRATYCGESISVQHLYQYLGQPERRFAGITSPPSVAH